MEIRYLLLGGILSFLLAGTNTSAATIERVLAIVGDEFILQSEFEVFFAPERIRIEASGNKEDRDNKLRQAERTALDKLIERKMLASYAKADLKGGLEKDILINKLKMRVSASVSRPSSGEIKAYYDEHRSAGEAPGEVSLSQILLNGGNGLKDVDSELKNGVDFAAAARRYSNGSMAQKGGFLGFIPLTSLIPEIREVVARLDIGQVSGPIKIGDGFCIVKLEDRRQPFLRSLDEVRVEIEELLYRKGLEKAWDGFVSGLREKTYIKIIQQ